MADNIYACVYGGDIYKRTNEAGDFVALAQTTRNWMFMAAAPNGDVYACEYGVSDIYKQAGGTGDFTAIGETARHWRGIAVATNGDVYACVLSGDIYKQTGGTGFFVALGQTSRSWTGMCAAPNGDIYACEYGVSGNIYRRAAGGGDFVSLAQTPRNWWSLVAAPNGDIYAGVDGGYIYKRAGGVGDFVQYGGTPVSGSWTGMCAASGGDIYAGNSTVDIYIASGGTGDFTAIGGTARSWQGMASVAAAGADPGSVYTDTGSDGVLTPSSTSTAVTHGECTYSDFDTIGTFRVSGWDKQDRAFLLSLEDKRKDLKRKIPVEFYTRMTPFGTAATYPNMDEDSEGDPIPIAYGVIYDVKPVCIDLGLMKFKVAGHAIKDFLGCRVWDGDTETWTDVVFATTDEANGEFTLGAASWDREAKVAVDFAGKVDSNGDLMDNAADIVEDILTTYLGATAAEIHTASFLESHTRLYLGTDSDGAPVNARRPSLYLKETEDATKVLGRINALVGSSLFPDASGIHRYVVFEPEPGNSCETFDEAQGNLFSFTEEVTAEEIVSSVRAAYQYRSQQEYPQIVLYERAQAQYLQGAASRVLFDEKVPCDRANDATTWAQRSARLRGERQRIYRAQVSHRGWTLLPAQQIRIVYARHGVNHVFEVLEVKRSLSNALRVELVLGDLHGYGIEAGFLSVDSPVFPDSLGGGSAEGWDAGWTDAQKAWARQNIGYISDDNGFADSTDPDSFNTFIVV